MSVILCIRTDKPLAELYLYDKHQKLTELKWEADRQLSVTLHSKIDELFKLSDRSKESLAGIVIYKGPGSFTGLRIGFSVANALAYAKSKPVVSSTGADWVSSGIDRIMKNEDEKIALPEYGGPAHTTVSKT